MRQETMVVGSEGALERIGEWCVRAAPRLMWSSQVRRVASIVRVTCSIRPFFLGEFPYFETKFNRVRGRNSAQISPNAMPKIGDRAH